MIRYLDIGEVIIIHEKMIEIGGGRRGIRDYRLLHSAVERPKATFTGRPLYPTIYLKAAALIHSLIKNHPFNDGNKRTGFFSTLRFLHINGYEITASHEEIIKFALSADTKNLNLEEIAAWFKTHSRKRKF